MSAVRQQGHEIDLIFDPGLDDNLFLKAPHLAWMNHHEVLLERARAFKPDLVAMGALTNLWPFASKMAEKLKQTLGKPILVGGHHAQAIPDYVLANPHVDMACTGEGEIAMAELCDRMQGAADARVGLRSQTTPPRVECSRAPSASLRTARIDEGTR